MLSCVDPVVHGITQRIVSGIYQPGQRLPAEPQFQREWGVSRSVVREAMKILCSRGLIRIEHGRGTFVQHANDEPLQAHLAMTLARREPGRAVTPARDQWDFLLDVRRVLEIAVAERAAQSAEAQDIEALAATIRSMRASAGDPVACADADLAFHRALARASANPLWPALLNSFNDMLRRFQELNHHGIENALRAVTEHEAIRDAVQRGDAAAAAAAMQAHLETSGQDLKLSRRKHRIKDESATDANQL